jgi:hypothetical protein
MSMHEAMYPRFLSDVSAPIGLAVAVTLALGIAGVVTIAGARSANPSLSAVTRTAQPAVTTINRRLKGDRLDRVNAPAERPSADDHGVRTPELIVPKIVPAAPAADPVRFAMRADAA